MQTAQFEALPVKDQNYCQIFKMQIEQSTFQKIANKEVEWEFSDSEEAAIYDMRLGMEKTFMFGVKSRIYDSKKKEEVSLTGGIWWQAGKEYTFDPEKELTQEDLIDIAKEAFTGNGGNKRKILIGGSDFIGRINKLDVNKIVSADEDFVKWGIDFSEIRSKFGRLFILYSEVFDECGMSDYGFIFDPEFLSKWSHVPFDRQVLDLKGAACAHRRRRPHRGQLPHPALPRSPHAHHSQERLTTIHSLFTAGRLPAVNFKKTHDYEKDKNLRNPARQPQHHRPHGR